MIPFAGWGATAGKAGYKATREVAEGATEKAAREAAEKKAAQEGAEKEARQKNGAQIKQKKKKLMECAEKGRYGDLKKKTGEGKFDRDHIPSKEALKRRAEKIKGKELTPAEAKAIEDQAWTIAIPKIAHQEGSRTYGRRNAEVLGDDVWDLAKAAKDDVEDMLKYIKENPDVFGKDCADLYKEATEEMLQMTDQDYVDFLDKILDNKK
jgi:hypothetical protein